MKRRIFLGTISGVIAGIIDITPIMSRRSTVATANRTLKPLGGSLRASMEARVLTNE